MVGAPSGRPAGSGGVYLAVAEGTQVCGRSCHISAQSPMYVATRLRTKALSRNNRSIFEQNPLTPATLSPKGARGEWIRNYNPLFLGGEGGAQAPGEGGRWQPLEMLFRNEP